MAEQVNRFYLECKNVTKNFGGVCAVDKLTFNISKGELLGIIGPNGSGKTTLLNLITGVSALSRGEIWFKGKKLNGLLAHQICKLGISRTFQDLQIFNDLSVIDNLMVSCWKEHVSNMLEIMLRLPRARKEQEKAYVRSMEILRVLSMDEKASAMPLNLPFKERKLVGIGRALVSNPELLLLDEPGGGLSVGELEELSEVIVRLHDQGVTILFIEHRMEIVRNISDRVIVLCFGQKLSEGTFDEIQKDEKVISAYLG